MWRSPVDSDSDSDSEGGVLSWLFSNPPLPAHIIPPQMNIMAGNQPAQSTYSGEFKEKDRFDGKPGRFESWKARMKANLNARDVWGYVDGSIPDPSKTNPPGTADEILKWNKGNNVAFAILLSGLDEVTVTEVEFLETAEAVWSQLKDTYQVQNILTLVAARNDFFGLRLI